MPLAPGPLGFITPADRNPAQHAAHADAAGKMVRLALATPEPPKGTKLILTDLWKHPDVVADVGRELIRELQHTGSCVKVGGTNALRVTIASQRVAAESPTKAFEPFCWHNYAMSRHYFGDDGRGEGSMGSTFAKSLHDDGDVDWPQDTADQLPDYKITDGYIHIAAGQELDWSSYRNRNVQAMLTLTRKNPVGSTAELRSTDEMRTGTLNGYGISFACDRYIGRGQIQGNGGNAYVAGEWDGRGGHQQWVFGYWNHPDDGPLFAVGNNWDPGTYPKDPAGLPLCCLWVPEKKVEYALRNFNAEVYAFSKQAWFPAQPKVLDFSSI
jgi:hypothetical protein